MRLKIAIGVFIVGVVGVWAFFKFSDFMAIDKCLDSGGAWNYETRECEYELTDSLQGKHISSVLIGSKWYSKGYQIFDGDTLTFVSDHVVENYSGELTWTFDSEYEINGDTIIISTIISAFELADVSDLKPELIEKYLYSPDTLKLVHSHHYNYLSESWVESDSAVFEAKGEFFRVK
jgi:hypothetical protein